MYHIQEQKINVKSTISNNYQIVELFLNKKLIWNEYYSVKQAPYTEKDKEKDIKHFKNRVQKHIKLLNNEFKTKKEFIDFYNNFYDEGIILGLKNNSNVIYFNNQKIEIKIREIKDFGWDVDYVLNGKIVGTWYLDADEVANWDATKAKCLKEFKDKVKYVINEIKNGDWPINTKYEHNIYDNLKVGK